MPQTGGEDLGAERICDENNDEGMPGRGQWDSRAALNAMRNESDFHSLVAKLRKDRERMPGGERSESGSAGTGKLTVAVDGAARTGGQSMMAPGAHGEAREGENEFEDCTEAVTMEQADVVDELPSEFLRYRAPPDAAADGAGRHGQGIQSWGMLDMDVRRAPPDRPTATVLKSDGQGGGAREAWAPQDPRVEPHDPRDPRAPRHSANYDSAARRDPGTREPDSTNRGTHGRHAAAAAAAMFTAPGGHLDAPTDNGLGKDDELQGEPVVRSAGRAANSDGRRDTSDAGLPTGKAAVAASSTDVAGQRARALGYSRGEGRNEGAWLEGAARDSGGGVDEAGGLARITCGRGADTAAAREGRRPHDSTEDVSSPVTEEPQQQRRVQVHVEGRLEAESGPKSAVEDAVLGGAAGTVGAAAASVKAEQEEEPSESSRQRAPEEATAPHRVKDTAAAAAAEPVGIKSEPRAGAGAQRTQAGVASGAPGVQQTGSGAPGAKKAKIVWPHDEDKLLVSRTEDDTKAFSISKRPHSPPQSGAPPAARHSGNGGNSHTWKKKQHGIFDFVDDPQRPVSARNASRELPDETLNYSGPTLVARVHPDIAVGMRKPEGGEPRRTYRLRKSDKLQISGSTAPPDAASRSALRFSTPPSHAGTGWARVVKFSGQPNADGAADEEQADELRVSMPSTQPDFWYLDELRYRFALDPCEWGHDYAAGVKRIEDSMKAAPGEWDMTWIRANTSRAVRASCVRTWGRERGQKANTFAAFKELCTAQQSGLATQERQADEEDFERGCDRLVAAASVETFDMLVAMRRQSIYNTIVAFGRELSTTRMTEDLGEMDRRLLHLIRHFCSPSDFTLVLCQRGKLMPRGRGTTRGEALRDSVISGPRANARTANAPEAAGRGAGGGSVDGDLRERIVRDRDWDRERERAPAAYEEAGPGRGPAGGRAGALRGDIQKEGSLGTEGAVRPVGGGMQRAPAGHSAHGGEADVHPGMRGTSAVDSRPRPTAADVRQGSMGGGGGGAGLERRPRQQPSPGNQVSITEVREAAGRGYEPRGKHEPVTHYGSGGSHDGAGDRASPEMDEGRVHVRGDGHDRAYLGRLPPSGGAGERGAGVPRGSRRPVDMTLSDDAMEFNGQQARARQGSSPRGRTGRYGARDVRSGRGMEAAGEAGGPRDDVWAPSLPSGGPDAGGLAARRGSGSGSGSGSAYGAAGRVHGGAEAQVGECEAAPAPPALVSGAAAVGPDVSQVVSAAVAQTLKALGITGADGGKGLAATHVADVVQNVVKGVSAGRGGGGGGGNDGPAVHPPPAPEQRGIAEYGRGGYERPAMRGRQFDREQQPSPQRGSVDAFGGTDGRRGQGGPYRPHAGHVEAGVNGSWRGGMGGKRPWSRDMMPPVDTSPPQRHMEERFDRNVRQRYAHPRVERQLGPASGMAFGETMGRNEGGRGQQRFPGGGRGGPPRGHVDDGRLGYREMRSGRYDMDSRGGGRGARDGGRPWGGAPQMESVGPSGSMRMGPGDGYADRRFGVPHMNSPGEMRGGMGEQLGPYMPRGGGRFEHGNARYNAIERPRSFGGGGAAMEGPPGRPRSGFGGALDDSPMQGRPRPYGQRGARAGGAGGGPMRDRGGYGGRMYGHLGPQEPVLKLRSGGSRVADRRRSVSGVSRQLHPDNEDAFAVDYGCFAVADGFEGRPVPGSPEFSSAAYAQELVQSTVRLATEQVNSYISGGRRDEQLPPVQVMKNAASSVGASGAAAVLLGMLNPLTGMLSVSKLGDIGYLALRAPAPRSAADGVGDLEVITAWRPYMRADHVRNFVSSHITSSPDLTGVLPVSSWDSAVDVDVQLEPQDIVIAATDGFFDAVHIIGSEGLPTRQFIRDMYMLEQLDPGQLAEKLLLRAWHTVQSCRNQSPHTIDTPFMREAQRQGLGDKYKCMPEDDIAVVVSYALRPNA